MKIYYTILFSAFLHLISNAQESKRVLFLGNSYVGVNNLPQMVSALATSAGDEITQDSNTPGGMTLQGHSTNSTSLNKIMQGNWDYVVLQEQSQMPSLPNSYVQSNVYPYAQSLSNTINQYNDCAETIFYMTWGRENGDQSNCASWPPVCTYEGMDDLLQLRYTNMAQQNSAILSPVAAVWRYLRTNNPEIQLYSSDESHPSLAGSYAAACAFYSVIFRKSPLVITNNYSLPNSEAEAIRFATQVVVADNFAQWFVGTYDPVSQFTFDTNNNSVSFTNASLNSTDYYWDFGDGNTSELENPTHSYSESGIYTASLTSSNCGIENISIINIEITALNKQNFAFANVTLSPNPTLDFFHINSEVDEVRVYDFLGRKQLVNHYSVNGNTEVDCRNLSSGIYVVSFSKEGIKKQIKLVIQ